MIAAFREELFINRFDFAWQEVQFLWSYFFKQNIHQDVLWKFENLEFH